MGRLRGWVRRLERATQGDMVTIPQQDGPPARFRQEDLKEAFENCFERLGAGDDAPPRHPLLEAARSSSDPKWRESYFSDIDSDDATSPIEDLSE